MGGAEHGAAREAVLEEVKREVAPALTRGDLPPAVFVLPAGARRYKAVCPDLIAAGDNDLGIPPRAFAYAAIGMLAATLGAAECWVADPAISSATAPPMGPKGPAGTLVVSCFARGRLEVHTVGYAVGEDGTIDWAEVRVRSTGEPGGLGLTLPLWRAMNREPAPLPPSEDLLSELLESGFAVTVEEA